MEPFKRISARTGGVVALNMSFKNNGALMDPYAIIKVNIYKNKIAQANLVEMIEIVPPDSTDYPAPLERGLDDDDNPIPGKYVLNYAIPSEFEQDVYFDEWVIVSECNSTDCLEDTDQCSTICGRFYVFTDCVVGDDELEKFKFGFESLNHHFSKPAVVPLEVGVMPLPLYDHKVGAIQAIASATAKIMIETDRQEVVLEWTPIDIALRSGSYRSNPYVLRYTLATSEFLAGTYAYKVMLKLRNGDTYVSKRMYFTIAR